MQHVRRLAAGWAAGVASFGRRAGRGLAVALVLGAVAMASLAPAALAQDADAPAAPIKMVPHPWQIGLQAAGSPVEARIHSLHTLLMVIITLITVFVAGLLLYVLWKFDHKKHPVPTRTSHNTVLEVAWTVLPVLILVIIAIPSFKLVYYEDRTADPFMTIKVTGHQWYWEYAYPDRDNIHFESYVVPEDQLKAGQLRLLDVDNKLVLPAGKRIRILTTSADVIHSFFIPSLGVQRYAIPGRTIETWVEVNQPGVYYGECNQICGNNHSAMPISIEAMSEEAFNTWVGQAKTKFAEQAPGFANPPASHPVAAIAAPEPAARKVAQLAQ